MRILILGGAKSGKSSLAQDLCIKLAKGGPRIYWATMIPSDKEDEFRIQKHIEDRDGLNFETIECPKNVNDISVNPNSTILFDSITAVLGNEMFDSSKKDIDHDTYLKVGRDIKSLSLKVENFVAVCDDLWQDCESYDELIESYRKGLALICRDLAKDFDAVYEVICGNVNELKICEVK